MVNFLIEAVNWPNDNAYKQGLTYTFFYLPNFENDVYFLICLYQI